MVSNQNVAHRYFYQNGRETLDQSRSNVSYYGPQFYSYYTVIGLTVECADHRPALLYSYYSMTPTTSKHIGYLRSACPFPRDRQIAVPFRYGQQPRDVEAVVSLFADYFEKFDEKRLARAPMRRELLTMAHSVGQLAALTHKVPPALKCRALKLAALAADGEAKLRARQAMPDTPERAMAREKRAAAKARKVAELAEKLAKFDELPYLDRVKLAYGAKSPVPADTRLSLKRKLSNWGYYSLVWIVGDHVLTSKGVTMPLAVVRGLLRRWMAGELAAGMHAGPYELRELAADHVQIGCHCIPVENLNALAAELLPAAQATA